MSMGRRKKKLRCTGTASNASCSSLKSLCALKGDSELIDQMRWEKEKFGREVAKLY